jgi:alkyldihydroxyacetonephosphate synthase
MAEADTRLWGWLDPGHPDPIADAPLVDAWLARQVSLGSLEPTPPVPFDPDKARESRLSEQQRAALARVLANPLSDDPTLRAQKSVGQSYPDQLERRSGRVRSIADAVVFPDSAAEIQKIVDVAVETGLRLAPFGGGTSVVGGFEPPQDKRPLLVVDMSHMDRVLDIADKDQTATVEAGVRLDALEDALSHRNLTLGHYPQSFHGVTVGGAIAANGSGQRSDQYGRISDVVLSARLATPAGFWATESFRHAAAGPWLGGLVAGSEGLFGIVTDATLSLHRAPEHVEDRAWLLPSFAAAVGAARELAQACSGLAMLRISDEAETAFLTGFRLARVGADRPPMLERLVLAIKRARTRPVLVVAGYEGDNSGTARAFRQASAALGKAGGVSLGKRAGTSWRKARYDLPYLRESIMARGLGVDTFETAALWSKLVDAHSAIRKAIHEAADATLDDKGGRPVVLCHIGHGYTEGACLYFTAIWPRVDNALEQWRAIKKAATEAIVASGGALSHHHGLGADHAPWVKDEKGALGVDILTALARTFDPDGVMAVGAARALKD